MSTYTQLYVCRCWIELCGFKAKANVSLFKGEYTTVWVKGEDGDDLLIPLLILIAM